MHIQMIRSATRSDFRDAKLLHPGDLPLAADENGTRSNSVTNLSGDIEGGNDIFITTNQFTNQRPVFETSVPRKRQNI